MPLPDFPSDDAAAAKAWLADPLHHDFAEWASASTDEADRWTGLEVALSAVTGLKPAQLMKRAKNVVAHHLSEVDTKLWVAPEKRKEMAVEAAAEIIRVTTAEWKGECEEWLEGALAAFMPRVIKLWKKMRNASQVRSERGRSHDGASQISSPTKAPKQRSRGVADQGPPRAKKAKTDARNTEGEQTEERAPASDTTRYQRPRTLPERLIQLLVTEDTYILCAPTAILKDKLLQWPAADVREEHLDYGKLRTLLESLCDGDLTLHWGKENRSIRDEEDFTDAVGVMRFDLARLCLENVIL